MATAASIWGRHLADTFSITDAASYASASVTPTSGRVVLASFESALAGTPNTPTITATGLGSTLTWTQITTVTVGNLRATWWWAVGTGVGGVLTFDCGGQTQLSANWKILEFANVNTTTPIVQSVTNSVTAGGAAAITVTLPSALTSAMNRTVFAVAVNNNVTISGFSTDMNSMGVVASASVNNSDATLSIVSAWLIGVNIAATWTTAATAGAKVGIGIELNHDGTGVGGGGGLAANPLGGFVG